MDIFLDVWCMTFTQSISGWIKIWCINFQHLSVYRWSPPVSCDPLAVRHGASLCSCPSPLSAYVRLSVWHSLSAGQRLNASPCHISLGLSYWVPLHLSTGCCHQQLPSGNLDHFSDLSLNNSHCCTFSQGQAWHVIVMLSKIVVLLWNSEKTDVSQGNRFSQFQELQKHTTSAWHCHYFNWWKHIQVNLIKS